MALLEMHQVSKAFVDGTTTRYVVRDVSLTVGPGEILLIMGPSGSGKTTLLSLAGCVLKPTEGQISVNGQMVHDLPESAMSTVRLRQIGFVFQSFNLVPAFTAVENVMVPRLLAGVSGGTARQEASRLLERLGLKDRMEALPGKLSGGEKQRVAIARALVNNPAVVLADEPTANLDSRSGAEVARLFVETAKEMAKAVIIVTHDKRLSAIADRTIWMEDGRLVEGAPSIHE